VNVDIERIALSLSKLPIERVLRGLTTDMWPTWANSIFSSFDRQMYQLFKRQLATRLAHDNRLGFRQAVEFVCSERFSELVPSSAQPEWLPGLNGSALERSLFEARLSPQQQADELNWSCRRLPYNVQRSLEQRFEEESY